MYSKNAGKPKSDMTQENKTAYYNATTCHICKKKFDDGKIIKLEIMIIGQVSLEALPILNVILIISVIDIYQLLCITSKDMILI